MSRVTDNKFRFYFHRFKDILADIYNAHTILSNWLSWLLPLVMFFPDCNMPRTMYTILHRLNHHSIHHHSGNVDYWHGTMHEPGLWISLVYYLAHFIFHSVSYLLKENTLNTLLLSFDFQLLLVFVDDNIYGERYIHKLWSFVKCCRNQHLAQDTKQPCAHDVSKETEITNEVIRTESMKEHAIVVHNLSHWYGEHRALDHINLTIHKAECFGMLGLDGSGKTTMFKMLTSNLPIDYGAIFLEGLDSVKEGTQVRKCFALYW